MSFKTTNDSKTKTPMVIELPKSEKVEIIDVNKEPSDWSNELTAIDSEILRFSITTISILYS